jgi:hypothetical protein
LAIQHDRYSFDACGLFALRFGGFDVCEFVISEFSIASDFDIRISYLFGKLVRQPAD